MVPDKVRRAFTLVELLVVIAVIALLIGLMLPAIQRVREAANRTQCANNLKQIGLALIHYANERSDPAFPPYAWSPADAPSGGASWAVLILPFLEQENLFKTWNLNTSYYGQTSQARLTPLSIYFCPTRRYADTFPTGSVTGDGGCQNWVYAPPAAGQDCGTWNCAKYAAQTTGALGDYAGCVGADWSEFT